MTREAAVLGVPAYSAFAGQVGAVDAYLIETGHLERISGAADFGRIRLEKRQRRAARPDSRPELMPDLVDKILTAAHPA
jgi:predicted glycosyltransferase